jgi:glucose-6-phosphate 1-dehydrogenase
MTTSGNSAVGVAEAPVPEAKESRSRGTVPPNLFVIFGATGDLSKRKILPALCDLCETGQLGECSYVLAVGRRQELDDNAFRKSAVDALVEAKIQRSTAEKWAKERLFYHAMPVGEVVDFLSLKQRIEEFEKKHDLPGNRTFYLSLPPPQFAPTIQGLGQAGLNSAPGWVRIVIEKPFGRDLASAQALNAVVHRYFQEEQVYRIDHYLGKETVQNLLVFRLANGIFESLWNRNHVESVQILVAEELGIEDRAGYYDKAGALRDMVQNHLTQLFTLIAMEVPFAIEAEAIRAEKIKVLRSLSPIRTEDVVFGQYAAGAIGGKKVPGYLEEQGVPPDSKTETYVALKLALDNWRWQGVPFYIRTGKRLEKRLTQISVTFRRPPVCMFQSMGTCLLHSNVLLMTLQPDEGFALYFDVKAPGEPFDLKTFPLDFRYGEVFKELPEAYETLLLDVMVGDQTLFVHSEEVEASWRFYEPLLHQDRIVHPYPAGTSGPSAAERHFVRGAPEWLSL